MDLADLTNPVPKGFLDEGDKMFVFDGEDVCLVPVDKVHKYATVTNVMGGIVAADESESVGQINVEDLIVAMVGINQALKGAVDADFVNAYSNQFNIDNVRHKLREAMLLPTESIDIVDIKDNEQGGVITELEVSAKYGGPNAGTMTARSFSISCVNVESGSEYEIVDINYQRDGVLTFVIQDKEGLGAGIYDIEIQREPMGYYDAITLNYEYTIE